jgi:hypothetical protein
MDPDPDPGGQKHVYLVDPDPDSDPQNCCRLVFVAERFLPDFSSI